MTKNIKRQMIEHIKENAIWKDIYIDSIEGEKEHLHVLNSLGAKQTVSEIAQLLKGESSFWINSQNLIKGKFVWQDEYFAVSVSESVLPRVRKYIRNQPARLVTRSGGEDHHKKIPFSEEYDEFIRKYGFHE